MSVFVDMPVSFCYSLLIPVDTKTVRKAGNSESEKDGISHGIGTGKNIYNRRYLCPSGWRRAELIDGKMLMMAPPNTVHQRISYALARKISDYIDRKKGSCEVFLAPFAVFLNQDDKNYVEPDISVICDKSKLNDQGCNGAPDWVIEVTSPSNPQNDYGIKLFKS